MADHKKGWKVYTCHNGDRFHSISLKSVYCPCSNSTQNNYRINKSMIVFCIHLAVWNNVCSRFRGIEYKRNYFICWLILKKKSSTTSIHGTFPLVNVGVSWIIPWIEFPLYFSILNWFKPYTADTKTSLISDSWNTQKSEKKRK